MLEYDFNGFLLDNRLSTADIARQLHLSYMSISRMQKRGTIKPSFLAKLESLYKTAPDYLNDQRRSA